jgi:hypothetical protein
VLIVSELLRFVSANFENMANRLSSSSSSAGTGKLPQCKAVDRQAFLEGSIKQVRKGFQNYTPFSNENMMTMVLQPTPDTLPVGALSETEPNGDPLVVIPTVQFPHIYPHPSVSLKCVVCSQAVPSCCRAHQKSNIRFIASSPAPFIALCDTCVDEIFVRK